MEKKIVKLKSYEEIRKIGADTGYGNIIKGYFTYDEAYCIYNYKDYDDYCLSGVCGEYVSLRFGRDYDVPEHLREMKDMDVQVGDVVTLKNTEDVPSSIRGRKFSVSSVCMGFVGVHLSVVAVPYTWIESVLPTVVTIGDIVGIDECRENDSADSYYQIPANYESLKDDVFTVTRVQPTMQYLVVKSEKLECSYKVAFSYINNIIHCQRSQSIIDNTDIIRRHLDDDKSILFLSKGDKLIVERLVCPMDITYYDLDYTYNKGGVDRSGNYIKAEVLQNIIGDYSIIVPTRKINPGAISSFSNSVFDDYDDYLSNIPSISSYYMPVLRSIINKYIVKYYFYHGKYYKSDDIIDFSKIPWMSIDLKLSYNYESNSITYNGVNHSVRCFIRYYKNKECNDSSVGKMNYFEIVKLKKEFFVGKKLYGLNTCINAHCDSLFMIVEVFDDFISVSDGYTSIDLPYGAVEKKINQRFLGTRLKDFMMDMDEDSFTLLSDVLYPEITEDGEYIQYISPERINRFTDEDFWNKELREKYGTKKKIRKVIVNMFHNLNTKNVDYYLSLISTELEVEFLEGNEIYEAFDSDNLVMESTQGSSCMIDECEEFFDIYRDNARIAVVRNDKGLIIARAMFWEIEDMDGTTYNFMDRVYYSHDLLLIKMKSWARKNGYALLEENTYNSRGIEINKKIYPISSFRIVLESDICDYYQYPFIDSFPVAIGRCLYPRAGARVLQDTCGSYEDIED